MGRRTTWFHTLHRARFLFDVLGHAAQLRAVALSILDQADTAHPCRGGRGESARISKINPMQKGSSVSCVSGKPLHKPHQP